MNINSLHQLQALENISCDEIVLDNLDTVEEPDLLITTSINKLKKDGILKISGYDIVEISRDIITGALTINDVNKLLYKNNNKSINNLFKIVAMLQEAKLTIIDKRIQSYKYIIQGQKL